LKKTKINKRDFERGKSKNSKGSKRNLRNDKRSNRDEV